MLSKIGLMKAPFKGQRQRRERKRGRGYGREKFRYDKRGERSGVLMSVILSAVIVGMEEPEDFKEHWDIYNIGDRDLMEMLNVLDDEDVSQSTLAFIALLFSVLLLSDDPMIQDNIVNFLLEKSINSNRFTGVMVGLWLCGEKGNRLLIENYEKGEINYDLCPEGFPINKGNIDDSMLETSYIDILRNNNKIYSEKLALVIEKFYNVIHQDSDSFLRLVSLTQSTNKSIRTRAQNIVDEIFPLSIKHAEMAIISKKVNSKILKKIQIMYYDYHKQNPMSFAKKDLFDIHTDFGIKLLILKISQMWNVGMMYPPDVEVNSVEWRKYQKLTGEIDKVILENIDIFQDDIDLSLIVAQFYIAAYNMDFAESISEEFIPMAETFLEAALNINENDPSANYLTGLYFMLASEFGEDVKDFLQSSFDNGMKSSLFPLLEYYFATEDLESGIELGESSRHLFHDNESALEALDDAIGQMKSELFKFD